jgi:S-methylmethionine-dependent homocysteine/selenocysteine methylase
MQMAHDRSRLPQLSGELFLSDGGIETTLIFHEHQELPDFAAFVLLKTPSGRAALERYFRTYAALAVKHGVGCVLESATWRASRDWGDKLGYSVAELEDANRQAVHLLHEVRREFENERTSIVVSGCIGPRGDGYRPDAFMSADAARDYHTLQARAFGDADADLITAITMTYANEAIGIVRAAQDVGMPVVISFTVETDGRLPSGQPLADAIAEVDAATDRGPAYYMLNCAHPTHFAHVLVEGELWLERIRGLRANASCKSHAELNESAELDVGDPAELGRQYRALQDRLTKLSVVGGCCGTDHRHVEAICLACQR